MNITISIIKITNISNIGSLNIGKTILSRNEANSAFHAADPGQAGLLEQTGPPDAGMQEPPALPGNP